MTPRDRPAFAAVSAPPRVAAPAAVRPSAGPAVPERPVCWDDLYPQLTPAQQAEVLAIARGGQAVQAARLTVPANGQSSDRVRRLLSAALAGRLADWMPVRAASVECLDVDLDASQREAVAKALATPDLCLIQGLPGSGKSRVAAEIVTQAAIRGERVLLVSPLAAAVDGVLEQVGPRDSVGAIRLLGREERIEQLPSAIAALTFDARLRHFEEHTLGAARRQVEVAHQRHERRQHDEAVWERCRELADAQERLRAEAVALAERRDRIGEEVARDADAPEGGPLVEALAASARTRQDLLAVIAGKRDRLEKVRSGHVHELSEMAPHFEEVRPLAEAKQRRQFWTGTWWKATLKGNPSSRLAELEVRQQELHKALADLGDESAALDRQREQAEADYQATRRQTIEQEIARRRADIDDRDAALRRDRDLVAEKWRLAVADLAPETAPPADPTPLAVERAVESWRRASLEDESQAACAREWAEGLAVLQSEWPKRVAASTNVVAAPLNAVAGDPHFGDATNSSFDLLVVEHAHLLAEADFIAVARRARRWVLIGEADFDDEEPRRAAEPRRHGERDAPRPRPRIAPVPTLLPRLWDKLHADPRRLPYQWFAEGQRLGCRLHALSADQRSYLESEPVVDFPDIELRILARPRTAPILAEVLFPAGMSALGAKEYLFRELQELPVRAGGAGYHWSEDAAKIVVRLSEGDAAAASRLELEAGVRELLIDVGTDASTWRTLGIEFDRAADWDRARAETWLERHLRFRDLGRTACLGIPHRSAPHLAVFLSDLLFANVYGPVTLPSGNGQPAPVEFVPVPALHHDSGKPENGRRNGVSPRGRSFRAGAGLELDLADPRSRDRLPAELRPELPATGLVNFLEAQALVRTLESLGTPPERSSVMVLALYPAQAELIRCLIRRCPVLADADIRVDVPAALRECEAKVVFVSLTRSHTHRAVAFGEGPRSLTLAMTRARQRLILFGDPGTLVRRGQWEGPVDHLDDAAAARERDLINGLLRYLHGDGTHAHAFHLHESGRA